MTTHIDFRTLPANVPTLCIPRVYSNISESRIRKIFDELNMGSLERIDMISKHSDKGEKYNRVFVHFTRWNDNENACIARERLLNGKDIKIIYDDPWFWKISAYREPVSRTYEETKDTRHEQRDKRPRPRLQLDADSEAPPRKHFKKPHNPSRRGVASTFPHETRHIAPTLSGPDRQNTPPVFKEEETMEDIRNETIMREENSDDKPLDIDYGDVPMPPPRRLTKKTQVKA